MTNDSWVEPEVWYQQLPTVHVAAMALIRDSEGRVLIVKPNYRQNWTLPGGMAEKSEPPDVTVAREIDEELGLKLDEFRLAVVDWASPQGHRKRPLTAFIFDGGVIEAPSVRLQESELEAWRFALPAEMGDLMSPRAVTRIEYALAAVRDRAARLLVDGHQVTAQLS